ncbi:LAFE_0G19262g1_1 [Lachancea fermentati]|uniref:LAFE_0G19262g1_1 n=1 Tax=Lachancea fermentati TaxID=4955 RepID=A0A1G4MIY7_LACFM|nr:LAFE_0G19262g1_1 [Lachancea fermentati]
MPEVSSTNESKSSHVDRTAPGKAHPLTVKANEKVARSLPFSDTQDFKDAMEGFIGTIPDALILNDKGEQVWSMKEYDFLKTSRSPDTVNPSLWRIARLNAIHGLFKVTERVYQVRGFDIANMTIIEGETSLIIIDPLLTIETARAALSLYFKHRPTKPVSTVIYTHSHSDHYGGVKGVVNETDVLARKVQVVAPSGFMESVVSETFLAGNAMKRRAQFQFGMQLPPGAQGFVDSGIGKAAAFGTVTLISPTITIKQSLETLVFDGVKFTFQLAPGSEAPSEMLIYLPQFRILNMAEDVTHHMHNIYAIRGVEVRDASKWSKYIDLARIVFGEKSDVLIAQHHWPTFGQTNVRNILKKHRDMYKFIHDQTLRLVNHGYTGKEIAEMLRMPGSISKEWSTRGYYGTLSHNSKAVYQKYMGWYDGNPANLNPLPPVAESKKLVEYMGGAEEVLKHAKSDYQKGEFRWVASVTSKLVYADPSNVAARELCADALEQLGYQAEASTWRNAYLVGSFELRHGPRKMPASSKRNTFSAVSSELIFDYLAVKINATSAEGTHIVLNWCFTDSNQEFIVTLENCALTHIHGMLPEADATISLDRSVLDSILIGEVTISEVQSNGKLSIKGNIAKFELLISLLDRFDGSFPIIEPLG